MTTEAKDNEREAAKVQQAIELLQAIIDSDGPDEAPAMLLWIVAKAYLGEHPEDDNEPITAEWLELVGWKSTSGYLSWRELYFSRHATTPGMHCPSRHLPHIKTRGDLRRLCSALGITLEKSCPNSPTNHNAKTTTENQLL